MALSWDLRVQSCWRKDLKDLSDSRVPLCEKRCLKAQVIWIHSVLMYWQRTMYKCKFSVICTDFCQGVGHTCCTNTIVSRAVQRYLWLLWMHFISFEESSVLFWIDTALRSHPPFQLPQRAFHQRRLFRAPPLCTLQLQKAKPLWPTIPSLPFHLSQPQQCTTQAPQHPPSPHGHTLNLWTQLPHLQVEPLLGQCTRRSSL